MLHRDSREIVNTGDHLTTVAGETSCSGWDLGCARRAPNQYGTTCANVPEIFWDVVVVIVCSVGVLGTIGKGWAVRGGVGMVWELLRRVGEQRCWSYWATRNRLRCHQRLFRSEQLD